MKEINIIVATSTGYGIGYDNKMCWHIPEEIRNFQKVTSTTVDKNKVNCVIMGKNTWQSLPEAHRPLKNRVNIVLSKTADVRACEECEGAVVKNSFEEAIEYVGQNDMIEKGFVIGGEQLYNLVLSEYSGLISKIYLSVIYDKEYLCDKFINRDCIYDKFKFEKENIHFTERYVYMIGHNKKRYEYETCLLDEPAD
jgi:dihydrofolate reductase